MNERMNEEQRVANTCNKHGSTQTQIKPGQRFGSGRSGSSHETASSSDQKQCLYHQTFTVYSVKIGIF